MTVEVLDAALTQEEARVLTDALRNDVRSLWVRTLILYEGQAHTALGYPNFEAYWGAEFGGSGSRGLQILRAARVMRVLQAAELETPLPANELVARELYPVFHRAPADLPAAWSAIVESTGQPTARTVREAVAPYRALPSPTRRSQRREDSPTRETRKLRSLAAAPIQQAHTAMTMASENLPPALTTNPSVDTLREWLEHVERTRELAASTARKLRREVGEL